MSKWTHRRWPGGCWFNRLTGETVAASMNLDRLTGRGYIVWINLAGERQWGRFGKQHKEDA